MNTNLTPTFHPRIVIIGGGFGGIELAKNLKHLEYQVVLIDRNNYHTFQPLLYQVATGGLEPDSIAYPLRRIFRDSPNIIFRMADVKKVIAEKNEIETSIGNIPYDFLVIATGSQSNFFNFLRDDLMPLKSIPDALNLRSLILQNFEKAHLTIDLTVQERLLNIAIAGGGPTGVELAGALAEMKKYILPKDYPELDIRKMQIHLFEAAPRLLSTMSVESSMMALEYLKKMGVTVWLNTKVTGYDGKTVSLNDRDKINTDTLIWTAGVKGENLDGLDEKIKMRSNRIKVDAFNKVEGYENVYAIGDVAEIVDELNPAGYPMLAPVAIQQGDNLAINFKNLMKGKPLVPFKYIDKGTMATVGRNKAVVDLPKWKFQGAFAWFVWMFVHIWSLVGFKNKLSVFVSWVYSYFTYDKALRLIIRPFKK